MHRIVRHSGTGAAAVALLSWGAFVAAQDSPPAKPPEGAKPEPAKAGKTFELRIPDVLFLSAGETPAAQPTRYFIGLNCAPIKPEVRAQLDIPDNKGIAVEEVLPDSPAQKAGVKPHDVLLAAGDKELGGIEDLSSAIQAAGKNEVKLTVLRAGQKQTISVTPAETPQVAPLAPEDLARFLEAHRHPPAPGFRFHLMRPGIVIDIGRPNELPDDVRVTVTKQGKSPAAIVVERGDKSWKATEDKLEGLPDDVLPWVRRSIGIPPGSPAAGAPGGPVGGPVVRVLPGQPQPPPVAQPPQRSVEQRLEDTLKQLEALRKSVEDLRKDVPKPAAPQ